MIGFEINDSLCGRIEELNRQYLTLIRDIAMSDPTADFTLGFSRELIELLSSLKMPEIIRISKCGVLLAKIRVDDAKFWSKVQTSENDTHDLLHALLERETK